MTIDAHRHRSARALLVLLPTLGICAAHGDVTLKQHLRMEGGGLLTMMNMSGDTVTTISGERSRTDSDLQMESRFVRMFAGGGSTAQIVRLDEGKLYQLDPGKKTYTEMSFADQKAQMQKSMDQMRDAQEQQKQGSTGVDESDCQWSEPTASVRKSGETEVIAGARAERVIVTATQSCKDPKTNQVCDFNLVLDQWVSPDFQAGDEVSKYYRAYAEQLGLDVADSPNFAQRLESMFGGYKGIWGEIAEKMKDNKGYPLRSTVSLAVGGSQCKQAEETEQTAESSPGIGKAVGGALGGAFGRFLGGRRDKAAQEAKQARDAEQKTAAAQPAADSALPADTVKLMSITSELVSVTHDTAPAGTFEVPAGYRQVGP